MKYDFKLHGISLSDRILGSHNILVNQARPFLALVLHTIIILQPNSCTGRLSCTDLGVGCHNKYYHTLIQGIQIQPN